MKQRITAIFLAILLMGYVGSTCFFVHEHEIGDVKIVHSHPYSSSSHNHSTNALTAISLLSHIVALADMNLDGIGSSERLLCIFEQKQELLSDVGLSDVLSLRAPPVL